MANLRLQELLAAAKAAKAAKQPIGDAIAKLAVNKPNPPSTPATLPTMGATGMHGEAITYNTQQQEIVDLVASRQSCVLIGAAGTGKTTSVQGAIAKLIDSGHIPILEAGDHKHLKSGTQGIIISAFTRRATNNIRKVLPDDLKNNCITIHKLLEFRPEDVTVTDPETGEDYTSRQFVPYRNKYNPLPTSIHTIIIEEASMLGTDLFDKLLAALSHKVQFIFVGDIQQLPPVFGPAILGFAINILPTVELTEVYRQALDSPIISLAHRILSGKPIPLEEYEPLSDNPNLTIHPLKKKLLPDHATMVFAAFFKKAIDEDKYDPSEDMILIPYNKACGTLELNKHIANYIARREMRLTYEIVSGFNRHYFSEGDKVLYDKEDATILGIEKNKTYSGARFQPPSMYLDYWGTNQDPSIKAPVDEEYDEDVDFLLSQVAHETEDRVTTASHIITLHLHDSDREITIKTASEINNLLHAYALTVHKSQGSEWRRVFTVFHHSHATMLSRELLYTAVTRAKEELYIICEKESMTKGINSQRIKGSTLLEKAEYFKGKADGREHNYQGKL